MTAARLIRAIGILATTGVAVCACSGGDTGVEAVGTSSSAITPISGCDYSDARPSPASLRSMGYHFVVRYLSGDPGGSKDLSASEAKSLTAAGLDIAVVWETTGTDARDGYNQGIGDAKGAKSEAESVGQPSSRPIYFAIDFDAESGDAASIKEYFKGVASVLGLSRTGVYGGYYIVNDLLNAKLVTFAWQTYAWSYGKWDSRAQLRQTQNGVDHDQLDADEAMAADFGQWGPNAPTTAKYAAQFVKQSFPLASTALDMVEGQTIPSYIELKNVGTATWDSNTRIGTTEPEDRKSVFADSSWLAPDRPAGVTGKVAPGDTYKFAFNLHAPSKSGTYKEYFGVVQEGVTWFSASGEGGPADNDLEAKIVVSVPEYQGSFDSQTYPLAPAAFAMHVGDVSQGSVTLTNTGSKSWVAGTTKLAPIPRDKASPSKTSGWLSDTRISSLSADVKPGDKGTFSLPLKATAKGDFEVEFGLVEEGVTWFADAPLGGGPADGFLRVHVTVTEDETDAGSTTDGSVEREDGSAEREDGGAAAAKSSARDSGAGRGAASGSQPTTGGEEAGVDGGEADGAAASSGGCNVARTSSSGAASLALIALAMTAGRRRAKVR